MLIGFGGLAGCARDPDEESADGEPGTSSGQASATEPRGDGDHGSTRTSGTSTANDTSSSGGSGLDGSSSTGGETAEDPHGRLVIDEVYFTGAEPFGDVEHYFSDQFIAVRNISDVPVAVGGLMVGDVFGVAGEINPGAEPNAVADDPGHVHVSSLWRVPGAPHDVVLEPGSRLVIAQDGTNHAPLSPLDLSGADFETFVADSEQDDDSPTVENLELLHYNAGFDWLLPVFGPSVVIVSTSDAFATYEHQGWTLVQIPVSAVVDGVDILMDADSGAFKRLPPSVDVGFTFASGTYTGEAVRRRREDGRSLDTDDSSSDFELTSDPRPRL